MAPRFLSVLAVIAAVASLVVFSGGSTATPALFAGSPLASPKASPVTSSPLLATMQTKQGATAAAKTATAEAHAGETATAEAGANATATSAVLTATAAAQDAVDNALAVATENAELQTAIVGAATSEAAAEQAAATAQGAADSVQATADARSGAANATATTFAAAAEATIGSQATEIGGLYATETVIAIPTDTPTATPTEMPTPEPTATPTDTPTATPLPQAGDVLYRTGKTGLKKWPTAEGWTYLDGMLLYDGTANRSVLLSPYQPDGLTDYAIEASVQVVKYNLICNVPGFGLFARVSDQKGYSGGVTFCNGTSAGLWTGIFDGGLQYASFDPGNDWHTYRLEVKGAHVTLLIDGNPVLSVTDNRFLSVGDIGIFAGPGVQLNVRSFKVTAL